MISISLDSDFRDYYDHWFKPSYEMADATLFRHSTKGPSKSYQFHMFRKAKASIPTLFITDRYSSVATDQREEGLVVVYVDENSHSGEGKLLLPGEIAAKEHPGKLASVFIPTTENFLESSISYRHLFVGDRAFTLKYTSKEWRSNCGEVEIEVLSRPEFAIRKDLFEKVADIYSSLPLLALDYVKHYRTGETYFVDLNIAPGLRGTGLEAILPGREIFSLIAEYFENAGTIDF